MNNADRVARDRRTKCRRTRQTQEIDAGDRRRRRLKELTHLKELTGLKELIEGKGVNGDKGVNGG